MTKTLEAREMAWLAPILDQIDYGIVLVDDGAQVLYANRAGWRLLEAGSALCLRAGAVAAAQAHDGATLADAVRAAVRKGLRTLVPLGGPGPRSYVSVMPIDAAAFDQPGVALLVAGRQEVSEVLSVQGYARSNGLTSTECQVMRLVCGGSPAQEIARRQGVAVSTIRTQIGSIRAKIGVRNIGALVQQVALLPPLPSVRVQEAVAGAQP